MNKFVYSKDFKKQTARGFGLFFNKNGCENIRKNSGFIVLELVAGFCKKGKFTEIFYCEMVKRAV